MIAPYSNTPSARQFLTGIGSVLIVSAVGYLFSEIIGYRTVALVLLLTVSLLAMRLSLYPVLVAAALSALIWDFFFIPPYFTFQVSDPTDMLMLVMYFIIALLNGVLTARIRHFENIARQKEEKANTLKLYDTLFNSLSHELRTPIATILGASDSLLATNNPLSTEGKDRLLHEINTASERLNRLVNNLLSLSRLESGFLKPKLDWCDLNELIYTTINNLSEELKNHPVTVKIADDLPLFKLDFGLMEQALHNILYNAAHYTPLHSKILVAADYIENQCVIVISDTGNGFPKEDLDFVFDKFHRFKNAKTGGIGLGLSITKGFIDAHGGTIGVENRNGGGAKFTISIPTEVNFMQALDDE